MNKSIDRDDVVAFVRRFWGTDEVRRVVLATNTIPTAEVQCWDMDDANQAAVELIGGGGAGVQRIEIDRNGVRVFLRDDDPCIIPFSDADMEWPARSVE